MVLCLVGFVFGFLLFISLLLLMTLETEVRRYNFTVTEDFAIDSDKTFSVMWINIMIERLYVSFLKKDILARVLSYFLEVLSNNDYNFRDLSLMDLSFGKNAPQIEKVTVKRDYGTCVISLNISPELLMNIDGVIDLFGYYGFNTEFSLFFSYFRTDLIFSIFPDDMYGVVSLFNADKDIGAQKPSFDFEVNTKLNNMNIGSLFSEGVKARIHDCIVGQLSILSYKFDINFSVTDLVPPARGFFKTFFYISNTVPFIVLS